MKSINILNGNSFEKIVSKISFANYDVLTTQFTDLQVKDLCSKMANHRIRYFSNLFLSKAKTVNQEQLRYQLHHLANKALEFYGGKILTFIYNLNNWPNKNRNVEVYISSLNNLKDRDPNFPKLEIKSWGTQRHHYIIQFKRAYERNVQNLPIMTIKNYYTSKLSQISRDGSLIENFENVVPEIILFEEALKGETILYSGYDDDLCDICGRPLTDYISIKYGRGPICRRDYGTP